MKKLLDLIDIERLYSHILKIEGIKHPTVDQTKLNEAASYIHDEMKKYGLNVREHKFRLDGMNQEFKNIEGYSENSSGSEILITSHYDTVYNSPGADDNGSAIAVMLECARILAERDEVKNIRFVSFSLEERNPVREQQEIRLGQKLGLIDDKYRFTNYHTSSKFNRCIFLIFKNLAKGKSIGKAWELAYEGIKVDLTKEEEEYFDFCCDLYINDSHNSWVGDVCLVGSYYWVKNALEENREIIGDLNLESVGYTSTNKHSQVYPPLMHPILFKRYKSGTFKVVGNFLTILSNKISKNLANSFCKQCKRKEINLPFIKISVPFGFKSLEKRFFDVLRADHASFWFEDIPALTLTDSCNFRTPFYHTSADTIDKLDFDFMKKVCQATLATARSFQI